VSSGGGFACGCGGGCGCQVSVFAVDTSVEEFDLFRFS